MHEQNNIITPPPIFDEANDYSYSLYYDVKDKNLTAVCYKKPDRIIPIIFVPGVMGSNLKEINKKSTLNGGLWRLDSAGSLAGWIGRGAKVRRNLLAPNVTEVDQLGAIDDEGATDNGFFPTRRERGWGEVAYMSYGSFLVWLQNALNDFDHCKGGLRDKLIGLDLQADWNESTLTQEEVSLSYKYLYPVYACGYNWLDSNIESAKRLDSKINEIKNYYHAKGNKCEKVIIVTHSMGGLVARYYSEYLEGQSNILGIVHGVMPSLGAAATYTRMKSGTEGNGLASHIAKTVLGQTKIDSIETAVAAKILGENAAEMTAVLSQSPGPLQLLPGSEYGTGWLKIQAGNQFYCKPESDPFADIYTVRGKWWSLCEDHLINPNNITNDKYQMNKDWLQYLVIINKKVKPFVLCMEGKFHKNTYAFYSNSNKYISYGNVQWNAVSPLIEKKEHMDYLMEAPAAFLNDLSSTRLVNCKLNYTQNPLYFLTTFKLSNPDEPGDGTVPHRSGSIPKNYLKSSLEVEVGHEPAYKDSDKARSFVLRAIVKISQSVNETSLAYK